jgi:hypothetical protein
MGYDSIDDIGVLSIRKGAALYLASLPGGPPPAAICLQGGWTMGQIKYIYFHQMQAGDKLTGRCISLLNLMSANFALPPAFLDKSTDKEWVKTMVNNVFPMFGATEGMGRILWMCLPSLVHHRAKALSLDPNHIPRTISIFCDPATMQLGIHKVQVIHVWESNRHLMGIPPHVKELVNLHALKVEQSKFAGTIYNKVMEGMTAYFEAGRIGGGNMTEAWMKEMIASVCQANVEHLAQRFEDRLKSLADTFESYATTNGRPRTTATTPFQRTWETYVLQRNPLGQLSRLPNDFQFPKSGMYNCWVQWNVGHVERSIPALQSLTPRNIAKLDSKKRSQQGSHQYKDTRRPSRKTYSKN